jgi:hypothetical protein
LPSTPLCPSTQINLTLFFSASLSSSLQTGIHWDFENSPWTINWETLI